ncbi:MAG: methylated-DNA--[protein]-cysteine S-methyltransferase [Parachlamydiaceae bacterium]
MLKFSILDTPLCSCKVVVSDQHVVALLWDQEKPNRVPLGSMIKDADHPLIKETEKQLEEYFRRQRTAFDLPITFCGGTPFQRKVWGLLNEIPYGATCSYKDIALKMNRPKAVRAVGAAIGKNPISIIVPCHRVLASNGHLTGFAGGLERKKALLSLESRSPKIAD